jgi:hypothetical protein
MFLANLVFSADIDTVNKIGMWTTECEYVYLNLYSIYMPFVTWVTTIDPDQLVHLCCLIWIFTFPFLVRNSLMNLKANSVDSDQTAQIWRLIWIFTVCLSNKSHNYGEKG